MVINSIKPIRSANSRVPVIKYEIIMVSIVPISLQLIDFKTLRRIFSSLALGPFLFVLFSDDHVGLWPSRGAGQYTDEKLQTVRDPTSLSAQR